MTSPTTTPLDTAVAVETPEHVVFEHRIAGPTRRAFAYLVDLVVCYGAIFILAIPVVLISEAARDSAYAAARGVGLGLLLVVLFFAQWVYFVVLEGWRGATVGKTMLGLRVVTVDARPLTITHAALRNVLRAADLLPTLYATGVVAMILNRRFQRLGDLVAGTMVVVRDRPMLGGKLDIWPPPADHELERFPARIALSPEERAAIELFLLRKGALGPARADELARLLLPWLHKRHGVAFEPPVRALELVYHRAMQSARGEAPVSLRRPQAPSPFSPAGPSAPPLGAPPPWP